MVGFNSSYILDFLKALGNEGEVRLEFKDSQSAGQMRPEDPDAEYPVPVCADADADLTGGPNAACIPACRAAAWRSSETGMRL